MDQENEEIQSGRQDENDDELWLLSASMNTARTTVIVMTVV